MKTILIVDGYNVIHSDDQLEKLAKIKLEEAREKLIHLLSSYGGLKGIEIILVFDAYKHEAHSDRELDMGKIKIVYTDKNKTADSYIEKLVFDLPRLYNVQVVTSDFMVQRMVLASGATRVPARELMEAIKSSTKIISQHKSEMTQKETNRLQDFMDQETLARFQAMRSEE